MSAISTFGERNKEKVGYVEISLLKLVKEKSFFSLFFCTGVSPVLGDQGPNAFLGQTG